MVCLHQLQSNSIANILQIEDLATEWRAHIIDGNNIVEVYTKVSELAESVRQNPRPILLEFKTFRMRGHEEASGTKYVPQDLMDFWASKDPLENFQAYLREENILTEQDEVQFKEELYTRLTNIYK